MRAVPGYRLVLGLLQGAALSALYYAYEQHLFPATDGAVFAPLLMVALFVPLIAIQSLRVLRLPTLLGWTAIATIVIAALSFYDIWRAWPQDWVVANTPPFGAAWQPHVLPSWPFIPALAAILFIAHALIVSADIDRRFIARYATYFDVAWEQGVQLALTAIFVGVFWALMWLGAGLFELLKIDFLVQLFRHYWFWMPATTIAIAVALHVTDARVSLVRGARVLALTLMSLLLPLLTLLVIGFLGALGVKGLEPLWNTKHAAALLVFATVVILVLINTAYQDGARDRTVSALMRLSARIAAILPVPLVALAAYALALRIEQYGWSADRVIAAAAVIVAACHALGYLVAAFARPWLQPIERWNVVCGLVTLLALLALFSPIADPARISVNDQMARVASGKIIAAELDLNYLRWDAGRFGKEALETVATRQSDGLRNEANRLLAATARFAPLQSAHPLIANLTIHTADGKLPESFLNQEWSPNDYTLPACLHTAAAIKCDVFVKDLKGDGSAQVMVVQGSTIAGFDRDMDGVWHLSARWISPCNDTTEAVQKGDFAAAPPEAPLWPDLEVAGQRLRFNPQSHSPTTCPKS